VEMVAVVGLLGLLILVGGGLGLYTWLLVSRLVYGVCVLLALTVRLSDPDSLERNYVDLANDYYDRIPFVQK
jgi:hypothetical protein